MRLRILPQSNALAGLRRAAALLAASLALAACGAGHDADCLKSNGPVTTQRRAITRGLTDVVLFDNVDVTIVPDTATYAEVRAGENVLDDIVFEYQGPHRLLIRNTSRCNWVRSYNTPREVRLHLPSLRNIEQRGYGLVTTDGLLRQDTLFVHSSSTGDINLEVSSVYLFIDVYDAGDMTLRGTAEEFSPQPGQQRLSLRQRPPHALLLLSHLPHLGGQCPCAGEPEHRRHPRRHGHVLLRRYAHAHCGAGQESGESGAGVRGRGE
ncbi:MAG: DUF2807 domain-containing protein [Hymenobacter sp.]